MTPGIRPYARCHAHSATNAPAPAYPECNTFFARWYATTKPPRCTEGMFVRGRFMTDPHCRSACRSQPDASRWIEFFTKLVSQPYRGGCAGSRATWSRTQLRFSNPTRDHGCGTPRCSTAPYRFRWLDGRPLATHICIACIPSEHPRRTVTSKSAGTAED